MTSRLLAPWLWTPVVLVLDFLTKRMVLAHQAELSAKVRILGDFLRFIYVRNPGSAMGLFPVGPRFLIVVSALAVVFLVYLYRATDRAQVVRRTAVALILGGALGNLVDRIWYDGKVVDFIDVGLGDHRFYTFNVADIGVSIGGVLLFLCLLLEGRRRHE